MPINYLKQIQLGDFDADGYRISPSVALKSIIEGFYEFTRDVKDNQHLIFNDGFPVIVFLEKAGDIVQVTKEDGTYPVQSAWASAGSIKNVHVQYNNSTTKLFIVRFHPGAFYKLFGLSASFFRKNPVASFGEIAKTNDFDLPGFYEHQVLAEKISFIENYVQHAYEHLPVDGSLNITLDHIHESKGNSTVKSILENVGVNYKWLERNFVKNIGLLPKEYIQLQRFKHAYLDLVDTSDINLLRIAISYGYYDTNHFMKDFKGYTGKTPLEYLKSQAI